MITKSIFLEGHVPTSKLAFLNLLFLEQNDINLLLFYFIHMNTPCTYYFILSNIIKLSTNKVRNQLHPIHSRTLDAELTF